ncbi:hypothetical protein O5165_25635, partial [Escherichia coli]|nr:hypothetical protein [Escherichia coli]
FCSKDLSKHFFVAQGLTCLSSIWGVGAQPKLIESFGEVCVLPLPSDAGHRLFPSVPFREGERRRQKTTLTEQKYSRQRERE